MRAINPDAGRHCGDTEAIATIKCGYEWIKRRSNEGLLHQKADDFIEIMMEAALIRKQEEEGEGARNG